MSFVIGLLTSVLFLICLFLGLLILVQLPKKEAGMGTAFGGDAAVAVFGAGSGNALTRMTKYSAVIFLALCVMLTWLNARNSRSTTDAVKQELAKSASSTPSPSAASPGISALTAPTNAAAVSNTVRSLTNAVTPKN
jgi:preprotein translocase subunit SecG